MVKSISKLVVLALIIASTGLVRIPMASAISTDPARVLVVYKSNAPDRDGDGVADGLELANYYASKRSIPAANLLGVNISVPEYYYCIYSDAYTRYINDLVSPIKTKLASLGPTSIDTIFLVGEIPTVVCDSSGGYHSLDNTLMGLNFFSTTTANIYQTYNPYFERSPTFGTDLNHFDHSGLKLAGGVDMYMVIRLGSQSDAAAMDQIDQIMYAEQYLSPQAGYYNGNAYVDTRYQQPSTGAAYTDAFLAAQWQTQTGDYTTTTGVDYNIAYSEHFINALGLPLKWENTSASIGDPTATFIDGSPAMYAPRALFYGGWYNYGGANDTWEWLPGSIADDLNSGHAFSDQVLSRGASCAAYVMYEPYTTGIQRPNVLYYYLLQGYTFAEAATLATPNVGWMNVNECDPLYAPLRTKTPVMDTQSPTLVSGYPTVLGTSTSDRSIKLLVDDSSNPEVAKVKIDYGTTTSYGSTVSSKEGYYRRFQISFPTLTDNTTYHYKVTLTDPVGNVTTSSDMTFNVGTGSSGTPIVGDINLDHIVNSIDYSLLNAKWFTTDTTCDLNHDGIVNSLDYSLLNSNWFKTW